VNSHHVISERQRDIEYHSNPLFPCFLRVLDPWISQDVVNGNDFVLAAQFCDDAIAGDRSLFKVLLSQSIRGIQFQLLRLKVKDSKNRALGIQKFRGFGYDHFKNFFHVYAGMHESYDFPKNTIIGMYICVGSNDNPSFFTVKIFRIVDS